MLLAENESISVGKLQLQQQHWTVFR